MQHKLHAQNGKESVLHNHEIILPIILLCNLVERTEQVTISFSRKFLFYPSTKQKVGVDFNPSFPSLSFIYQWC